MNDIPPVIWSRAESLHRRIVHHKLNPQQIIYLVSMIVAREIDSSIVDAQVGAAIDTVMMLAKAAVAERMEIEPPAILH